MRQVVLTVERVFDLSGRRDLLVAGRIRSGLVRPGVQLLVRRSGQVVTVEGIELLDRREAPDSVTVRVSRDCAGLLCEGDVLESP